MQTTSIAGLLPVLIFLVLALGLAIAARRRSRAAGEGGFVKEYFIGNRTLGGFVLAMTTIATYGSVSSFVGGPGQAWQTGFGWVYMAAVQVTTLFLLYGIMGKKMALVSRKRGGHGDRCDSCPLPQQCVGECCGSDYRAVLCGNYGCPVRGRREAV